MGWKTLKIEIALDLDFGERESLYHQTKFGSDELTT